MMHCVVPVAALLLAHADGAFQRAPNRPLLLTRDVQSQQVLANGQTTKAWSGLVSALWSELVIEESGKPIDIGKSDKAVKDSFVADCVLVLDVHVDSIDSVDKVVKKMCNKAGGKGAECTDMTKTLWQAHKDEKLKPWCEKTFAWFTAKTKPRCLKNCKALLCKDRCQLQDQSDDLSDQIAAYNIKMDTFSSQNKRLEKVAADQKAALAAIEKHDKTKCAPLREEVKKLEGSQATIGKELDTLIKASLKAGVEKDKAFADLTKLKADKKAKEAAKSKAEADFEKTTKAFNDAKDKQSAKNKSLKDVNGKLKEASSKQSFQEKKLKDMKAEYDAVDKANGSALKAVAADKKKIQDAMDKVIAEKKKLGASLTASLKAM